MQTYSRGESSPAVLSLCLSPSPPSLALCLSDSTLEVHRLPISGEEDTQNQLENFINYLHSL